MAVPTLLATVGATSWVTRVTGNPNPYSFVPHSFLDLNDKTTLLGSQKNTLFIVLKIMRLFYFDKQQEIYDKAFPTFEKFRPFWHKLSLW